MGSAAEAAAASSASSHRLGSFARCSSAARSSGGNSDAGNSDSIVVSSCLHWSGLFMWSESSAPLHRKARRCAGVSFFTSESARLALHFFHESKRSWEP